MPGWHKKTKELVEAGRLKVAGIVQEQHSDRAALFMQWKKMSWPVLADPFNELGIKAVPITLLIDGKGVIRYRNPKSQDLAEFLKSDYSSSPAKEAVKLKQKPMTVAALEAASPKSGIEHFQLGVAYRKRFDSDQRKEDDFSKAIASWRQALALNPNQYIWRRRIQQYGPRLDKPYSFYDWVNEARRDCLARGEKPIELGAEPGGSEFAHPARKSGKGDVEVSHPDVEKEVTLDEDALVGVRAITVPTTKGDGKAVRVHLRFQVNEKEAIHWTNDAGPLRFFPDATDGVTVHDLQNPGIPKTALTSDEDRLVEFEVRPLAGKSLPKSITGNAYYYVCRGDDGVCLYLRNQVLISLE